MKFPGGETLPTVATEDKAVVKVRILDKSYTLSATKSPEHLERVAEFVDAKMRELKNDFPNLALGKVAVLTAINLADEILSSAPLQENDMIEIRRRVHSLIKQIDQVLTEE